MPVTISSIYTIKKTECLLQQIAINGIKGNVREVIQNNFWHLKSEIDFVH